MNCYNGEKYLQEAIDSVYAQSYKNWEIIFWDNASKDLSANIAKSYDSKVKYFFSNKTISLGHARNKAIEQSKGSYVAFLDVDDIWYPNKLEKQLSFFVTDDKLGLVYTNFHNYYLDGSKVPGNKFFRFKKGQVFKELLKNNFIVLSSVIIPKNIIVELKGFPGYSWAEEYDLFLKIAYQYNIDFVKTPSISYRYHDSNASLTDFDTQLRESKEIYDYWSKVNDIEIKKICHEAIGLSYYSVSRRLLFHLKDRQQAKLYIKYALIHQLKLKFVLFYIFCFPPVRLSIIIRKFLLIFLR